MAIKSVEDFQYFMNETIALQIFEPESANPDSPNFDPNEKSTYIFQKGIVPLGKLRMRQQRRKRVECDEINQQISELRDEGWIPCLEPSLTSEE